jgi:putative acetyltransferase
MHFVSSEKVDVLRQDARKVVRELGLLSEAYFDIGVTLAERHLLIELESCLFPNVGDIAERLILDKSSASRLIAKAVKKGFVKYSHDESDKRKRCLQITEHGRKTLRTFEPLAQKQVVDALETLAEEEQKTVHEGLALFAKALGLSRLRNSVEIEPVSRKDNIILANILASQVKDTEVEDSRRELQGMYEHFHKKGRAYFVLRKQSKVIGGLGIDTMGDESGACILKHMNMKEDLRGLGLEELLVQVCMKEAKRQGYLKCYVMDKHCSDIYQNYGFKQVLKSRKTKIDPKAQCIMEKEIT